MYRIIILPITEHVSILSLNKIVKILILDEMNEKFREALRKFYYIFFNFRAQLFHYSLQDISV